MKDKNVKTSRPDRGVVRSAGTLEPITNAAPDAGTSRDDENCEVKPQEVRLEAAVILHELDENGTLEGVDGYLRNRGVVHRAMELLEEWKFLPARISSSKVPVDIIAIRKDMTLLVQVISSKKPIPNAKTLVRHYAGKIDAIRKMGTSTQFKKMLMAYSKLCGWKYYEVLPGGLIPAWHLPDVPAY